VLGRVDSKFHGLVRVESGQPKLGCPALGVLWFGPDNHFSKEIAKYRGFVSHTLKQMTSASVKLTSVDSCFGLLGPENRTRP